MYTVLKILRKKEFFHDRTNPCLVGNDKIEDSILALQQEASHELLARAKRVPPEFRAFLPTPKRKVVLLQKVCIVCFSFCWCSKPKVKIV